jgi:NAD-dependent deacetylase sirtuin 4
LVLGSSLATYSAWRLVKRAKEQGMPIGIMNMGGVRGEEQFFADLASGNDGKEGIRCAESLEKVLPELVERMRQAGVVGPESSAPRGILEGVMRNSNFVPAPWA